MKRVTVHHQGPVVGKDTVIVDEDGQVVENVKGVSIYLNAGELPEVTLELNQVHTNVEANVTGVQLTCPCCNVLLVHDCRDSTLGDPVVDPTEEQNYQILSGYISPAGGGQMVNGVWTPTQSTQVGAGSFLRMRVMPKPTTQPPATPSSP